MSGSGTKIGNLSPKKVFVEFKDVKYRVALTLFTVNTVVLSEIFHSRFYTQLNSPRSL